MWFHQLLAKMGFTLSGSRIFDYFKIRWVEFGFRVPESYPLLALGLPQPLYKINSTFPHLHFDPYQNKCDEMFENFNCNVTWRDLS